MHRIILAMAHPRMMFWLMPLLMALLVFGTLAQREIGLYEAERLYFASWIFWAGPIPLPGMYPLLALLTLSLLAKILMKSPWSACQSGNIITHMGALLLMLGGMMTALSSEEGYMPLAEAASSNVVADYHLRELVIFNGEKSVFRRAFNDLLRNDPLPAGAMPFEVDVTYTCRNCTFEERSDASPSHQGLASKVRLIEAPLEQENEANLAGARLMISGIGEQSGEYLVFEPMINQTVIELSEDRYRFVMRKTQRVLPFSVRLIDFEKQIYPGTETAREYQSLVEIDEGDDIRWQSLIRMNEPLRVMGYTLYQSSFVRTEQGEVSVLAVVKNQGRVFPYVASLLLGIGLIVHLMMRRRQRV